MYKIVNGKKRIFYLDQLRALAIMLVVMAHVFRSFATSWHVGTWQWFSSVLWVDISVMGVPLFLMISGSLLLNRDYDLKFFLKHRFSRILIPFIPWSLLLPFLLMFVNGYECSLASFIHIYLDKQYWFIWMLIGVYLFLPVVNSFVKEYKLKGVEYFLVVWLIVMVLGILKKYPFHELELSYFAGYLGYFVLGYYLANKDFKLSDRNMIILGFIIFAVFTFLNMRHTVNCGLGLKKIMWYTYLTICPVMQATGLFILFKYWAEYSSKHPESLKNKVYSFFKDSFAFKIIFAISTYSYGIFLVHYFPLNTLKYIGKHIVLFYKWNPLIWLPLNWLAVFVIAFLIVFICNHIPFIRQFSGAH
ncbi:acyltransferase [Methanobrevibacter sp.]|uniref:acyltransferase n=1 Tax=Methanobrevibacter sp. TaxID=66852 RepID=UPI0026DF5A4D|nr:acyltransferase [Methanobrevibacter sp.]MDO5859189.1 acyltransferase [Methanobrevibacter sp.]